MAITVYTYNDKVLKNVATDKWLKKKEGPEPIVLPGWTVRVKMTSGSSAPSISGTTVTAVQGQADVYDVCTEGMRNTAWSYLFQNMSIIEILGANIWNSDHTQQVTDLTSLCAGCSSLTSVPLFDTSGITNMSNIFSGCSSLTSVPLFDTSSVNTMYGMFQNCTSLTSIPLFDTSACTNMSAMFAGCTNVESGALALYQQASTQTTPPQFHVDSFLNCGRDTVTGEAELVQIHASWGGAGH